MNMQNQQAANFLNNKKEFIESITKLGETATNFLQIAEKSLNISDLEQSDNEKIIELAKKVKETNVNSIVAEVNKAIKSLNEQM